MVLGGWVLEWRERREGGGCECGGAGGVCVGGGGGNSLL